VRAECHPLQPIDLSEVLVRARWQIPPERVEGRSAIVDHPTDPRLALRAKGIAWTDPSGRVHPPSARSWFFDGRRPWLSCHVTPAGWVEGRPTEDRAVGAMPLARVDAEIQATNRLRRAGIAVSTPVGRGLYPGLTFGGESLGFLVFVEPRGLRRIGFDIAERGLTHPDTRRDLVEVGALLRRIHRAGLVDISPHLGNFSRTDGVLRAHDLDRWRAAEELTPAQVRAYRLRDTAIVGWSLSRRSYRPESVHARHTLAGDVMAGYLGDRTKVAEIRAVELIRFVRMLREGGDIRDVTGTWSELVSETVDQDAGMVTGC
jgi:hypothetical protein